ncbi:ATP-binding protein [Streptomyces sp. NPDC050085]|uniref:ATP-binding protein n=1 Tax=Streptomyces sp. NPDC050085 TaxID=3365600 RepID=UPI00378B44B1
MVWNARCMHRKSWDLAFLAEPEEVAGVRRLIRERLRLWGLHSIVEGAQLCVTELVSNVITHVGRGTPVTLASSMNGTFARFEIHDPDTRALPTLLDATSESEGGRGMTLVDAMSDRWGVQLRADRKVTWCELATDVASPGGHSGGARVARAEVVLGLYGMTGEARSAGVEGSHLSALSVVMAQRSVVDMVTDVLHWARAHGCDPDEVLEWAQMKFENTITTEGA